MFSVRPSAFIPFTALALELLPTVVKHDPSVSIDLPIISAQIDSLALILDSIEASYGENITERDARFRRRIQSRCRRVLEKASRYRMATTSN